MSKSIVIGGGSGFLGSAITQKLISKGYDVTAVSRSLASKKGQLSWSDVNRFGLPKSTTGVINLSGTLILDFMRPWTQKFKDECWSSRVETTRSLVEASRQLAQSRSSTSSHSERLPFIATSAVGFYPALQQHVDKPEDTKDQYDETSKPDLNSFFGKLCSEIENTASQAKDVARVCVVRPGVIYGKSGGAFAQLKLPFSLGLGMSSIQARGVIGSGAQFVPWVHVDDLASLYVHLLEHPGCEGPYNGVAPQLATNYDFTKALGKAMNRPTVIPVPAFVLKTLLSPERASMLLQSQKVVPKRTLESGFTFKYDTIQSCANELASK